MVFNGVLKLFCVYSNFLIWRRIYKGHKMQIILFYYFYSNWKVAKTHTNNDVGDIVYMGAWINDDG